MKNEKMRVIIDSKVRGSNKPIWLSEQTVNILLKEAEGRISKKKFIFEINLSKEVFQLTVSINEISSCEEFCYKLEKLITINRHSKVPVGNPIYEHPKEFSIEDVVIL